MVYQYFVAAVVGYLIGNIQFAVIISRIFYKDDVRHHGSKNAGSTNMIRVFGLKPGLLTFAGDFLKGVFGVIIGRLIGGEIGAYLCALFVVLGHDFPALFKFKGGKGVASSFGIMWCLSPVLAVFVTVLCAILMYLTRIVAVVSITGGIVFFILACAFRVNNGAFILLTGLLALLIIIRHEKNIRRLLKGEEKKIF